MKFRNLSPAAGIILALSCTFGAPAFASDHDDGSQAQATNNLNLTDLYAFREDNQTANAAQSKNLILIMNSNGHTPAGSQVFFNPAGRYDFHITRVISSDLNTTPTGSDNIILRFEFSDPDASARQKISLTAIKDGVSTAATGTMMTSSLADGMASMMTENKAMIAGTELTVFAGLREDPFFFDVEQFFKVRAGAAGLGPAAAFRDKATAVDGFAKQNVNSIVVRVPIAFLQTAAAEPVFDIWQSTSLR